MPTSSGHDRNNYSTSYNFSRSPTLKRRSDSVLRNNNNNNNSTNQSISRPINDDYQPRSEYVKKPVKLATEKVDQDYTIVQPIDPAYVNIQDRNLREIVQRLVQSENERAAKNIDPNLVTQIDHKGCSLYFSRSGANPFDIKPQLKPTKEKFSQTDSVQQEVVIHPLNDYSSNRQASSTQKPLVDHNNDNDLDEQNEQSVYDTSPPRQVEIPPEVNKIIQQDLAKNPLKTGERTYRIVINKNVTNPGQDPQIVRVVVKAQQTSQVSLNNNHSAGFLPQIQQKIYPQQQQIVSVPNSASRLSVNEQYIPFNNNFGKKR